jgi:hypothetical protein
MLDKVVRVLGSYYQVLVTRRLKKMRSR